MLGVSLPAARQIRELALQSKINFVTEETSADIVKEAIGLGAMGYVVKTKVQSELLKSIDSVLEGKQFIGSGLTGSPVSGAESRQGTAAIPSACHRGPEQSLNRSSGLN